MNCKLLWDSFPISFKRFNFFLSPEFLKHVHHGVSLSSLQSAP